MRWILALALALSASPAFAHDIYGNLRQNGSQDTGPLCCGGDPVTGDCEALNYRVLPSGDAIFESRRYGTQVLVAKDKITWMAVRGGEAFEAHWCGKPRDKMTYPILGISPDQPDPDTYTYCAFIAPGGV